MNKTLTAITSGVVALVVSLIVVLGFGHATASKTVGAQVQNDQWYFTGLPIAVQTTGETYDTGELVQGTAYTTAIGSVTLPASALLTAGTIINNNATGTAMTITLPATSTLATFLPNVGDREETLFINASTTGATVTLAGNTGVTLESATSTKAIVLGGSALVELTRVTPGSIVASIMGIAQ